MKCAWPGCPQTDADELNISLNVSEMDASGYSGWTDFAPQGTSQAIGTTSCSLGHEVWYWNADEVISNYLTPFSTAHAPKGATP